MFYVVFAFIKSFVISIKYLYALSCVIRRNILNKNFNIIWTGRSDLLFTKQSE